MIGKQMIDRMLGEFNLDVQYEDQGGEVYAFPAQKLVLNFNPGQGRKVKNHLRGYKTVDITSEEEFKKVAINFLIASQEIDGYEDEQ